MSDLPTSAANERREITTKRTDHQPPSPGQAAPCCPVCGHGHPPGTICQQPIGLSGYVVCQCHCDGTMMRHAPSEAAQGQAALVREQREAELVAGAKPTVAEWIEHALAFLRSIDMDTAAAEDDQSDAIHALEEALDALGAAQAAPLSTVVEVVGHAGKPVAAPCCIDGCQYEARPTHAQVEALRLSGEPTRRTSRAANYRTGHNDALDAVLSLYPEPQAPICPLCGCRRDRPMDPRARCRECWPEPQAPQEAKP